MKTRTYAQAPDEPAALTRRPPVQDAWQHSPLMAAQRQRIAAAFGPAGQVPAMAGQVVQRVPLGHYVTTADANLRDKEKKDVLAKVKEGTSVEARAPLQTLNFSLGVFSIAKDHTWVQCLGQQGWLRDAILAARQPPPQPVIMPTAVASAPSKQIAISGAKPRRAVYLDSSDDDAPPSSLPKASAEFPKVATLDIAEDKVKRFKGFHLYVHFTKDEYRQGIHEQGLKPGAQQGIGLPNESGGIGPPDADHVYVVSGSVPSTTSAVSSESGGAPVVVISRASAPDRDVNYPKGGAHRFGRGIGPGRNYDGHGGAASISLVLPLSPSGKAGLAEFLNEGAAALAAPITSAEAEVLLARALFKTYPIHFLSYQDA